MALPPSSGAFLSDSITVTAVVVLVGSFQRLPATAVSAAVCNPLLQAAPQTYLPAARHKLHTMSPPES
jgi:hypothetical protein